jgi:SAM-dependent methyltransferase
MDAASDAILRCPSCGGPLVRGKENGMACAALSCLHHAGFPSVDGQPVLIDFERSIFDRDDFLRRDGESVNPQPNRRPLGKMMRLAARGNNHTARTFAHRIIEEMHHLSRRPRLLVIGGGAIGNGAVGIYTDPELELIGTDVYASPFTHIVADGHRLPFADVSFDGVWIQAVLEHVLSPGDVVAEIHRVLKPQGLVFADTPFMQPVHEGAYDFTRFTLSGHRWLFRDFSAIDCGVTGGAGTAMQWSLRYLIRALTGSQKLASAVRLPLFWLRFLDGLGNRRMIADAAAGVYFFGRKAGSPIGPKDMVAFYEKQAIGK